MPPPLPPIPSLRCHWTRFEGGYLQTCRAEAGNTPVKTLWDGFLQTCVLGGQWGFSSSALPLAAPRAFGGAQSLAEFQPDSSTSALPGTRRSPLLSGECAPAPGQRWDPGAAATSGMGWNGMGWDGLEWGGMGWGWGLPCNLGLPLAQPHPWDATQPGGAPVCPSHPTAGWGVPDREAAESFSDLCFSVCLF